MHGQLQNVVLSKAASGVQEPFVKADIPYNFSSVIHQNENELKIRKGHRPMHTSTYSFSDNLNWRTTHSNYDREYSLAKSKSQTSPPQAYSYSDEIKTLGLDNFHRFTPSYGEHYCKERPVTTASELLINRLAIGAKQMDSVGIKDVMHQQRPIYTTQYGRTHSYLGLLKTIEPIPKVTFPKLHGYPKKDVLDTITGEKFREDLLPERGYKKSSVAKLISKEDNKFKGLRSIVSDGIS